jgi:(2R)-3-sulfolactate dehydrogenase (NADP+)
MRGVIGGPDETDRNTRFEIPATDPVNNNPVITVAEARAFGAALLIAAGMPEGPACRTAWALVTADAWGLGSHGLLRLPYYLKRFEEGGTDPRAELRLVSETASTAAFDGGNGLGHWQVWHAAETAATKACRSGVAAVSVGNSGHCGSLGLYTLPVVEADLVGLVFSNGPAVMPPWGGTAPVLSTSPLAAAFPGNPRPAIVDLATAAVARGKIAQRKAAGEPLEPGWALDSVGQPTTDAAEALGGMLAPMGGAKGYAIAFLVEALTGGVVGPNLAGDVADPLSDQAADKAQRIAHLVIAIDPGAIDSDGAHGERLATLASRIANAGGRVPGTNRRLPGEIGDDEPLPLAASTIAKLIEVSARLNVRVPRSWALPSST